MIDMLSRKSASGDISLNLALQYLRENEWGLAKMAAEQALAKGRLSEPETAVALLRDVCRRLGVAHPG